MNEYIVPFIIIFACLLWVLPRYASTYDGPGTENGSAHAHYYKDKVSIPGLL